MHYTIRFLIVSSIIGGWLFSGWSFVQESPWVSLKPKMASASVPSGVIIAWPSTHASIPTGWTRVTDFDTYFLKGTTTDATATVYGAATHTHTSPTHTHTTSHTHTDTTDSISGTDTTGGGTTVASDIHTHTVTTAAGGSTNDPQSANFGTASNDPPFTKVIFIESDGTGNIPDGAWALFNSDTLPTNWTRVNGNMFMEGADGGSGDGGGTGGSSDSHTHTDSGHTHTESSHTHTGTTGNEGAADKKGKSGVGFILQGHTHAISGGTLTATETSDAAALANGDGQPPFYKLNVIQNDTGGESLPTNIIAMWDNAVASPPANWILCDGVGACPNLNDRFIKGANADSELGDTGGALNHTHSAGTAHSHTINTHNHAFTADATSDLEQERNGGGDIGATGSHTHGITTIGTKTTGTQTVTGDTSGDNQPQYKGIAFIQYTPSVSNATQEQVAYKWFANDVSTNVGRGAGINTPVVAPVQGTPFRLRLVLHVATDDISQNGTSSDLQVAVKTGATCGDESFANVAAASGDIRFHNNAGVADEDDLTANTFDPRHSTTTDGLDDTVIDQDYQEANNFTNSVAAILQDQDGMWDFSLVDFSAPPNTTYCFRAVQDGGEVLAGGYSTYPEITTAQAVNVRLRGTVRLRPVRLR